MAGESADKPFHSEVLMNRIDKFEKAAVAKSWKGSQPVEDHKKIEKEYHRAKLALLNYALLHIL